MSFLNFKSLVCTATLGLSSFALAADEPAKPSIFSSIVDGLISGAKQALQGGGSSDSTPVGGGGRTLFETAWNDPKFNPATLNGAMHLRVGISSVYSTQAFVGDSRIPAIAPGLETCDWNYLFHAKSNSSMSEDEIQTCALLEENLRAHITGSRKNLNTELARQDVTNSWRPFIQKRIASFKTQNRFYFRPNVINFYPYDTAKNSMHVDIFMVTEANLHGYVYKPQGFMFKGQNEGYLSFRQDLVMDTNLARTLENAWSRGLFDKSTALFAFDVDKVYVGSLPARTEADKYRLFKLKNVNWQVDYFTPSGAKAQLSSHD